MSDDINKKMLGQFIADHAPIINMHANKLKKMGLVPTGVDMDDLHMAGVHGLMDAMHKFDTEYAKRENKRFVDYAHSRIRGMMLDHVKDQGGVPKHLINRAKNLAALESQIAPPKAPSQKETEPVATTTPVTTPKPPKTE
jgi:DNA-directed RNA polymerase specialized sigma subunit